MAFIGNDLWGSDPGGPFVINNAATTCQALTDRSTAANLLRSQAGQPYFCRRLRQRLWSLAIKPILT